jgi:peptidoglycan hydrolase CwlO-like protein
VAENQKAELEVQIAQLSEMSGDSSQQMAYLNDQLREKDRLVEELQGQKGSLTGQIERINQDVNSKEEKLVSISI